MQNSYGTDVVYKEIGARVKAIKDAFTPIYRIFSRNKAPSPISKLAQDAAVKVSMEDAAIHEVNGNIERLGNLLLDEECRNMGGIYGTEKMSAFGDKYGFKSSSILNELRFIEDRLSKRVLAEYDKEEATALMRNSDPKLVRKIIANVKDWDELSDDGKNSEFIYGWYKLANADFDKKSIQRTFF